MRREFAHKKRTTILASLALVCFGMWALDSSSVWAAFTAEALSEKNAIRGGSIELRVTPDLTNPTSDQPIAIGESIFYGATVLNHGKNTFRYSIALSEGEDTDCSIMAVKVKRDGVAIFTGAVTAFRYLSMNSLTAEEDEIWNFEFWIPDGTEITEATASCLIHFKFEAWQAEYALASLGGWTDSVTTPDLSLLPDPSLLLGRGASLPLDETIPVIEELLSKTEEDSDLLVPTETSDESVPETLLPVEEPPLPTLPDTPLENPAELPVEPVSLVETPPVVTESTGESTVQP